MFVCRLLYLKRARVVTFLFCQEYRLILFERPNPHAAQYPLATLNAFLPHLLHLMWVLLLPCFPIDGVPFPIYNHLYPAGEIITTLSPLISIMPRRLVSPLDFISSASWSSMFKCWSKLLSVPLTSLPPFSLMYTVLSSASVSSVCVSVKSSSPSSISCSHHISLTIGATIKRYTRQLWYSQVSGHGSLQEAFPFI